MAMLAVRLVLIDGLAGQTTDKNCHSWPARQNDAFVISLFAAEPLALTNSPNFAIELIANDAGMAAASGIFCYKYSTTKAPNLLNRALH
jgi:hypothetical protein